MQDEFKCEVSPTTKLEAYIGRRNDDVFIEVCIENPSTGVSSICLRAEDTRALSATLMNLAERLERHLEKSARDPSD